MDAENVYAIGTHVEKVHLPSGNSMKVSKLSSILKEVVAINNNYDGPYIYGLLSSGDLFFWNLQDNSLKHATGIPELVSHLPSAGAVNHKGGLHAIYTAFRQVQQQSTERNEDGNSEVQSHLNPKIFASDDCSSVIVVLGAVQVYIWEKEGLPKTKERDLNLCGNWSVVACPSNTPMPSLQSKEMQISICFSSEEPLRKCCHVTFSFLDGASLIATTLTLQWGRVSASSTPASASAAFWNTLSVAFKKIGIEEDIFQRDGLLVSRYAHNQSLMCIAVNSSKFPISKLVYLHPLCKTSLVIPVGKIKGHLTSSTTSSHWVSDLAWSRDNTYLVGCLRSGCVFLATRMGSLLTVSCLELPVQLHPSEFLPVHTNATSCQKDGAVEAKELPNLSFHVSFHPKKDQLLLSSSVRASVLALPDNGRRDADLVDQLLVSANHALYILSNSALTHDYAYIHCSTWRLARSVADLTQNESGLANPSKYEVKLWEAENIPLSERETQETVPFTEGEQLIRSVVDPLLAAWTITLTHKKPQLQEWQERARNIASLVVKLVRNLMQASANDDQSEHQAQVLKMLQLFHSFIRVLELWPSSLHMLKPSLWLTHHIMHTLLSCEKHAGEGSMVDTLLILSQTLLSIEDTLSQAYAFKPILSYSKDTVYGALEPAVDVEVTNMKAVTACYGEKSSARTSSLVIFRMKNLWLCMHKSARKLYHRIQEQKYNEKIYRKVVFVLSIVQSGLTKYNCSFSHVRSSFTGGHKFYLNGMIYSAIEEWKTDIITTVFKKGDKKNMGKRLHSILFALLLKNSFSGISSFVFWILGILKSQHFTIYRRQSSHKVHDLSSTPKSKRKYGKCLPKMNDLEISEIDTDDSTRESIHQLLPYTHGRQSHKKNPSINSHMQGQSRACLKRQKGFILAVRKLMGSLGRVMMAAVLQQDVRIPSPNNPHIVRASWISTEEPVAAGKVTGKVMRGKETKQAIQEAQWSSRTAAQALAIAGYWADVTMLAQELADTRTALVASLIATSQSRRKSRLMDVPEFLLPASIMKSCVFRVGPLQEIQPSVFDSFSELFQLAAMAKADILPDVLNHCLARMKEAVNSLEFKVQSDIYLPAPPLFCPQLLLDDATWKLQQANSDEKVLRVIIAGWAKLFSSVVSASGIAQPLLHEICAQEPSVESEIPYHQDLLNLTDILGPAECNMEVTNATGWLSLSQSWLEFLKQLWMLQVRDKLWLCLRNYSAEVFIKSKRRSVREKTVVEILFWCEKLYRLSEPNSWKEDIVATALTTAGSMPPSPSVAQALAKLILHPSKLPSLLKDRASRLFDLWRKMEISVDDLDKKERKTDKLVIDGRTSTLYTLFENACSEALAKTRDFAVDNEMQGSASPQNTLAILLESPSDEFRKLLSLYANMTFRKDTENFPQHVTQIPKLPEFGELIKKRELQAENLRKFSAGREYTEVNQNCIEFEVLDETMTKDFSEKKGFFRNLGMWQKDTGTTLMTKAKDEAQDLFRTRSLSLDPSKAARIRYDSFSRNSVGSTSPQKAHKKSSHSRQSRSQRRRHHSLSLHKKGQNVSLIKRSHSVNSLERKDRNTNSSGFPQEFLAKEIPLKQFLMLYEHLVLNIKDKEFLNTICLLQWILSRERKFCLSGAVLKDGEHSVFKKVDLSLQDIILAFVWDFITETQSFPVTNPKSMAKKPLKTKEKKSTVDGALSTIKSNIMPGQTVVENLYEDHAVNSEKNMKKERKCSSLIPVTVTNESDMSKEIRDVLDTGLSRDCSEEKEVEMQGNVVNKMLDGGILNENNKTELKVNEADGAKMEQEEEDILDDKQCQEVVSFQDDNCALQPVVSPPLGAVAGPIKNKLKILENYEIMEVICVSSEAHKDESDLVDKKGADLKEYDLTKAKPLLSDNLADHELIDVSTQYSVPLSDNSWKPFRPKSRMSTKTSAPRLVIEAKGQETVMKQQEISTVAVCKKKSLTPVETPSEVLDPHFHGLPKIMQFSTLQDSKVLSLSDLNNDDEEGNTCLSNSLVYQNDNTLDDVTLPESLHASDLEEDIQCASSFEKKNEVGKFKSHMTSYENRRMNTTVTLNGPAKLNLDQSKQPDNRTVPIQVKPMYTDIASNRQKVSRREVDFIPKQKGNSGQAFKLLTLPVSIASEHSEAATERYKPFKLKEIPYQFIQKKYLPENKKLITKASEHKSENSGGHMKRTKILKFDTETPSSVFKDRMTLLAIPTYTSCLRSAQEKSLKLLDPQQVFTFADRNMEDDKLTKFKILHNKKSIEKPMLSRGTKVKNLGLLDIHAVKNIRKANDALDKMNKEEANLFSDNKSLNWKVSESPASFEPEKPRILTADQEHEIEQKAILHFPTIQRVDKACQHITTQSCVNSTETQTVDLQKVKGDITREMALVLPSDAEQTSGEISHHSEIDEKIGTSVTVENQGKEVEVIMLPKESDQTLETIPSQKRSDEVARLPEYDQDKVSSNNDLMPAGQNQKKSALIETRAQKDVAVRVKDSDMAEKTIRIPCSVANEGKNVQTQTDHIAAVSLQQTDDSCMGPPASPPANSTVSLHAAPPGKPSQMAFSLNHSIVDADRFCHQPSRTELTNVLTQVDIPCKIVQVRLDAMGDKLNETIYGEELNKMDKPVNEKDSEIKSRISDSKHLDETKKSDSKSLENNCQRLFEDIINDVNVENPKSHYEVTSADVCGGREISQSRVRPDLINNQSDFIKKKETVFPLQENKTSHKSEDKEQEVHIPYEDKVQVVFNSGKEDMTMNNLVKAFSEGKITFGDLCRCSTQVVKEDNIPEGILSEKEDHMKAIQALEREAEETVKGLQESRQFMSKINALVQVAGELESQKQQASTRGGDKNASRPNKISVNSTSGESIRSESHEWQSMKSLFHKTGNSDILVKYIEGIQPKDLRFDVIDDIMKYTGFEEGLHKASPSNTSQPLCESYTQNDTQLNLSQSNCDKSFDRRSINSRCSKEDGGKFANQQSLKSSPVLHLDLTSLRSESSIDYNSPQYSDKKQNLPALTTEAGVLKRSENVRRWMREQRKKKLSQVQNAHTTNIPSKNPSEISTSFHSDTLTSRQLHECSREREKRKAQLREEFQRKREEEVEKLLRDHEEELSTHRALIKDKKCNLESMIVSKSARYVESKNKNKMKVSKLLQGNSSPLNACLLPKRNAELAFRDNLPLNRGKLNTADISKHRRRISSVHYKSFKSSTGLENDKKIQEEVSRLQECVRSSRKSRLAPRCSGKSTNRGKMLSIKEGFHYDQLDEDQTKNENKRAKSSHRLDNTSNDLSMKNNDGSSEKNLRRNGSFSLPLDRISEVDTSPSQNYSLRSLEQSPTGEDTSGDISWNVPDEIKMLLYK